MVSRLTELFRQRRGRHECPGVTVVLTAYELSGQSLGASVRMCVRMTPMSRQTSSARFFPGVKVWVPGLLANAVAVDGRKCCYRLSAWDHLYVLSCGGHHAARA